MAAVNYGAAYAWCCYIEPWRKKILSVSVDGSTVSALLCYLTMLSFAKFM